MNKKKKIIYIISDIDKSLAFEWLALGLQNKLDVGFILVGRDVSALGQFLKGSAIPYYTVTNKNYFGRLFQWFAIVDILKRERPEIIHTHLWNASLMGLSASWLLGVPKRIYTRHHATVHYNEHPSGLTWDKLCNRLATHIIAISKNVELILKDWDKADPSKITLIPHGFDFNYFEQVDDDRVIALRSKYEIPENAYPVVGVISRYTAWKGIQYIIPAFERILVRFPQAILILANARGDFAQEINNMLRRLPVMSYREILFENDLAALYKTFNVFAHVPVDPFSEAFGQTYIEALAANVPSVFTLSGIAPEFIENGKNSLVVDYKDEHGIFDAINRILMDEKLRSNLILNGRESIRKFDIRIMIDKLVQIYSL